MQRWINKRWLPVIVCLGIAMQVNGQDTRNDTLEVGKKGMLQLVFQAPPKGRIPKGDGSYRVMRGAAHLLQIWIRKTPPPFQNLVVNEGGRQHTFTLAYKEDAVPVKKNYSALSQRTPDVKTSAPLPADASLSESLPVVSANNPVKLLPEPAVPQTVADTLNPREAAYAKALQNARALKKVGAYGLARIEYDRAMRLNTENAPEILNEKNELPLEDQDARRANVEEVEIAPVPGSPQWLYDSVVAQATRQFADRRFDSAIVNYRLAGQILPEQFFPASQVRAIEWELAQIWKGYVSARVELLNKQVRAQLAQKKYTDALSGLYELMQYNPRDEEWVKTQFANVRRLLTNQGTDTDSILASVKIPDVWDVLALFLVVHLSWNFDQPFSGTDPTL